MAKRVRRTPEEARRVVLDAAEERLREHGLDGLAVTDVAAAAGMSHATLLHHFGSSDAMRQALIERMATNLLREVTDLLQTDEAVQVRDAGFFMRLFAALSGGGHARLIGWQHLMAPPPAHADGQVGGGRWSADTRALFGQLLQALRERLVAHGRAADVADRDARFIVLLVVSSALGFGIGRDSLLDDVGLTAAGETEFARWMAAVVADLMA